VAYEIGGQQFIALANNRAVWAFKAGGTVGPRPAPVPPPTTREWGGRVADTDAIQLGNVLTFNIAAANKKIDWQNDYDVNPGRAHVKAGTAVTWTNKSTLAHTITARDGSWATGVIQPGSSGTVTIAKAGTYEYICKEHPWSIGQLTVD
jgi:plastocyanin